VLIYDPKYASVWEMPVYSTVSSLVRARVRVRVRARVRVRQG